jgi:hypothetical protein
MRECFVIMPFVPELHYFYLYLKQHVEQLGIRCERGDEQVLTKPILEKINDAIRNADVIIADCSRRNPNVFYELGIAHAYGKKVILITHDPIQEAPSDIRHYDFIHYSLDEHVTFLTKLDNALRNAFVEQYESLFQRAELIFAEFRLATQVQISPATKEAFLDRVMSAERNQKLPSLDNEVEFDV